MCRGSEASAGLYAREGLARRRRYSQNAMPAGAIASSAQAQPDPPSCPRAWLGRSAWRAAGLRVELGGVGHLGVGRHDVGERAHLARGQRAQAVAEAAQRPQGRGPRQAEVHRDRVGRAQKAEPREPLQVHVALARHPLAAHRHAHAVEADRVIRRGLRLAVHRRIQRGRRAGRPTAVGAAEAQRGEALGPGGGGADRECEAREREGCETEFHVASTSAGRRRFRQSDSVLASISRMISSVPPPIGPRRASRAMRSISYSFM
jgi:hypothetical protein